MWRFIILAFLVVNVTPSIIPHYPVNLMRLFGSNELNNAKRETQEVCQSRQCKRIANVIVKSMNKSVNPCDDFYEYACGRFSKNFPIPFGMSSWNLWNILNSRVNVVMQRILNTEIKDSDILAVKIAKRWYKSCTNTDAMDKQGLEPLITTLSDIGGWPMIMEPDEWNEQEYNWQKVDDEYMRLTGDNTFYKISVLTLNTKNGTKMGIEIGVPDLPPRASALLPEDSNNNDDDDDDNDGEDDDDDDDDDDDANDCDDNDDDNDDEDDNDDDDDDDDDNNDNNDDDSDNNDDDSDDSNDDTGEVDNKNIKKKVNRKHSTSKISHKRNKISRHNKKEKSEIRILTKHDNHKTRRHRVKKQIITKKGGKRIQHSTHREKLHKRDSKKNHVSEQRPKTKRILNIDETHVTTTPRVTTEETNGEEETLRQYVDYISKVAHALAEERGNAIPQEQLDKDIDDMVKFQIKLTQIAEVSAGLGGTSLNSFQKLYDELNETAANGQINWIQKITALFHEASVSSVNDNTTVYISLSDYFEDLASLLDETSTRTIVNYMHWRFINKVITATTDEMRKIYSVWDSTKKYRSSVCKKKELNNILAYEYIKANFSEETLTTASDMLDDIQKEVEYQIKESDWMDDDTKAFVLAKLVHMKKVIGYSDWYRNATIVNHYFRDLHVGKSFYENQLSYDRFVKWKELRKIMADPELTIDPTRVNGVFMPWKNGLAISAADFQSPFFDYNRPAFVNFGFIGFVMAHEVNHGFDDTGHLYDKSGNNVEWLSAMAEAYRKRQECFVNQFNNYPVDKESNKTIQDYGNQTISDNIADTMGLQAVFRAYRRRERECGKTDATLPGLEEFTNDQLFFLSFANLWCEAVDSNVDVVESAKSDEHSTAQLRIIGSVSNSDDFAKAYNCPVGSPMNPKKKCSIWK